MLLKWTSVWVVVLASGCANTATCDPNQELRNGLCLPQAPPSDDAASDAGPLPQCGPDASADGQFGQTCVDSSECACPAPFCAVQPGESQGFCTQINCVSDPALCPSGWSCVDLSAVDPSYPSTCLQG